MATENKKMQQRRDTAANWTANNPTLSAGEIGFETNTGKFKIGDGATAWNSLAYATAPFTAASASAAASLAFAEDTDNGTNKITVTAPASIASDKTLTLPDATDTLVGLATTDTLTNKTLSGATLSGVLDAGGATSFEIPNSAAPTVDADGEIALDTSVADFSHGIPKIYGGEELAFVVLPIAQLTTPTNGHVIKYNSTNDEFELGAAAGGIGGSVSTTDNAIVRTDGTGGATVQGYTSGVPTISDTGNAKFPVDGSSTDPTIWLGGFASANGFYCKATGNAWEQGTAFVANGSVAAAFGDGGTYKELMISSAWMISFGAATALSGTGSDCGFSRAAASVIAVNGGYAAAASALQMTEMTAPAAPAANNVRIYAQDNGAGKTQLMALFNSGAAQQIAIEP